MRNQLIEKFFDDKLSLNYDIVLNFQDKTSKFNLEIAFKEKIDTFLFDKLKNYCNIDIFKSRENYKKVSDFFYEVIGNLKLDYQIFTLDFDDDINLDLHTFQVYLKMFIEKVTIELEALKKK